MRCALYGRTGFHPVPILYGRRVLKMLFYVQNRVATVPSRWHRNRRCYSTVNSLCSYLCHIVLSRSFIPCFRNASLAQRAGLHIGPGRLQDRFAVFFHIFASQLLIYYNIAVFAAYSVFATQ